MEESSRKRRSVILSLIVAVAVLAGVSGTPGPVSAASGAPGGTLVLGKTYTETYTDPGVYTGYDVKLPGSGRLSMTLDLVSGEGADYDFSLFDPENKSLMVCDLSESGKHIEENIDLIGGDYVLVISGQNTVGTVSFKFDFTPVKETFPDTLSDRHDTADTASKLGLNQKIVGHLAFNDDRDMYSVSIPKNGKLNLSFSTKDIRSTEVSLLDLVGNLMWVEEDVSTGKHSWGIVLEKGEYTLSIRDNDIQNSTGVYQLQTAFDKKSKTLPKLTVRSVKNIPEKSVKITWRKVINVSAYEVQLSKNKKFSDGTETGKISDVSVTSTTFFGLDKKKTYYVRMRCCNEYISGKTAYSKWSEVKKVKVKK